MKPLEIGHFQGQQVNLPEGTWLLLQHPEPTNLTNAKAHDVCRKWSMPRGNWPQRGGAERCSYGRWTHPDGDFMRLNEDRMGETWFFMGFHHLNDHLMVIEWWFNGHWLDFYGISLWFIRWNLEFHGDFMGIPFGNQTWLSGKWSTNCGFNGNLIYKLRIDDCQIQVNLVLQSDPFKHQFEAT